MSGTLHLPTDDTGSPSTADSAPHLPIIQRRFSLLKRLSDHLSMGPRKKSRPNPEVPASDNASSIAPSQTDSASQQSDPTPATPARSQEQPSAPAPPSRANTANGSISGASRTSDSSKARKSWYGSWRSKASPIAKVAKESIGVTGGSTTELASDTPKQAGGNPSKKLLLRRRASKGDPIAASMTKVNVTSNNSESRTDLPEDQAEPQKEIVPEPPLPPDPVKSSAQNEDKPKKDGAEKEAASDGDAQAPGVISWRYWWSRPDGYTGNSVKSKSAPNLDQATVEEAQKVPLPGQTPLEEQQKPLETTNTEPSIDGTPEPPQNTAQNTDTAPQNKSWFWSWSRAQNAKGQSESQESAPDARETEQPASQPSPPAEDAPATTQEAEPQAQKPEEAKEIPKDDNSTTSTGWAFWSRSKPREEGAPGSTHKEVGELAVADTPSQSHPEAAQFNEQEEAAAKDSAQRVDSPQKDNKSIRGRLGSKASKPSTPAKGTPSGSPTRKAADSVAKTVKQPEPSSKPQQPPNLLLPDFRSTYSLVQQPSIWKQLRKYFLGGEPVAPHLYIEPSVPRVKKAIAIGVHGYFPAPFIQKVIGQPTGTSIRFANAAAAAISEYTERNGYSCEIEKVALEGEGFIADRVTTLWKLLLNWIEQIKQADFILVACHSQGVPVAVQLVSKLVQFGCVNSAKIGICAMAGINLGPFAEYKPRFFAGSASELFDFSRPDSAVSKNYMGALEEILRYGVKLVYVGSIDDQLVSLESSTFSNISHPYIYRAVFVDGRIHAPDFITHLVGFALKLRNLGLPDHGLIRELSPALAGSLYSGEGHSRIYEDPAVYALAVSHALETTNLPNEVPLTVKDYQGSVSVGNSNPYFLPWAMRGLLEEDFVRREMKEEVENLLELFESWKPQSKGLKDVRFRLEAVKTQKSKL